MKRDSFTDSRGDEYLFEMFSTAQIRIIKKSNFGKVRENGYVKASLSEEATARLKSFLLRGVV